MITVTRTLRASDRQATPPRRRRHASVVPSGSRFLLQRKPGCACGGSCPRCREELGDGGRIRVGEPGDAYEREADQVADQVLRMPDSKVHLPLQESEAGGQEVRRQPAEEEEEPVQAKRRDGEPVLRRQVEEEEEETLQRKPVAGGVSPAGSQGATRLGNLRGGGQPLPRSVRAFFEPRFATNFADVRVHADDSVTPHALHARAFTFGRHIVFAPGEYSPSTLQGKRLLAHELTHVVQQRGGLPQGRRARRTT